MKSYVQKGVGFGEMDLVVSEWLNMSHEFTLVVVRCLERFPGGV